MKSNIVFIGMMGTYKSTVAKKLAKKLNMMFLDCDDLMEFEQSMTIKQMFDKCGEEYFRRQENKMLMVISEYNNACIACGGGAVLHDEAMQKLSESSIVIQLYATPKCLAKRVKNDNSRPLLNQALSQQTLEKLWEQRKARYNKWADVTISTSRMSSDKVVDEVVKYICSVADSD